jgi:ethanolamine utilization protein EutN
MLKARVIGNVWATRRLTEIPNGAFLELEVEVAHIWLPLTF